MVRDREREREREGEGAGEREFIHATCMGELQNYAHVKAASLAVVLVPRKLK